MPTSRNGAWTTKDSITWTQRIRKEESVNAKPYKDFSVRAAVCREDVPLKFKPGHLDPRTARFDINVIRNGGSFDPAETGLPEAMVDDFRRAISEQTCGPRERHQFFDTCGQELGWCSSKIGPPNARSQPSGSNPSKLGIGWLQNDGHGGPTTKLAAAASADASLAEAIVEGANGWARPAEPKARDVKEALGLGPWAMNYNRASSILLRRSSRSRRRRNETAPSAKGTHSLQVRGRAPQRPQSAPSVRVQVVPQEKAVVSTDARLQRPKTAHPAAQKALPPDDGVKSRRASRPQSAPAGRVTISADQTHANQNRELKCQEEAVQEAFERGRSFLNGHSLSRQHSYLYHPLSQCNESRYANAYTLTWRKGLFNK